MYLTRKVDWFSTLEPLLKNEVRKKD